MTSELKAKIQGYIEQLTTIESAVQRLDTRDPEFRDYILYFLDQTEKIQQWADDTSIELKSQYEKELEERMKERVVALHLSDAACLLNETPLYDYVDEDVEIEDDITTFNFEKVISELSKALDPDSEARKRIRVLLSELSDREVNKIYVASSWRNSYYPGVVAALRKEGFDVYDFRNPPSGDPGFHWVDVDAHCGDWTPKEYQKGLQHPLAERQFANDIEAMQSCDACVLVLPCGRSAHTEAGWFAGQGKKVIAYIPEKIEPELMYKLFTGVATTMEEVVDLLE